MPAEYIVNTCMTSLGVMYTFCRGSREGMGIGESRGRWGKGRGVGGLEGGGGSAKRTKSVQRNIFPRAILYTSAVKNIMEKPQIDSERGTFLV